MADIAQVSQTGSRSSIASIMDRVVAFCGIIPYAAVALLLRLLMAKVFFLSGQAKIVGLNFPLNVRDFDLSVTVRKL